MCALCFFEVYTVLTIYENILFTVMFIKQLAYFNLPANKYGVLRELTNDLSMNRSECLIGRCTTVSSGFKASLQVRLLMRGISNLIQLRLSVFLCS